MAHKAAGVFTFINTPAWGELRFDIDETVNPDIVGTMLDISTVKDVSVDAIFSSHNIEHLYPNEVSVALKGFLRVLKPDRFLVVDLAPIAGAHRPK